MFISTVKPCLEWQTSDWSACSSLCGPGFTTRSVACPVQDLCTGIQPYSVTNCDEGPCSFWWTGPWLSCSVTCGSGYQTRTIECVHQITEEQSEVNIRSKVCKTKSKATITRSVHGNVEIHFILYILQNNYLARLCVTSSN